MDKLLKTIDSLKMPSLTNSDANIPGTISSAVVAACDAVKTKKKERINHCRAVADAVCNPSVQGLTDYNKILESVTEVLFQLCNDPDSDIRLVASDCLNRIARTLKDSFQPKFHMEVYREIRKNQSPRSLRTALNIFAFVCPLIRPQKCRAFLSSLLPCFAQISKRTEELLYENIATSFTEIFKLLGPFAHDSEIKILCKDFIANLESNSAIIRRASATILVAVSQFSKYPAISLPQLLSKTTDLLMPSLMEKSVSVIIGILLCVRQCIPRIYDEIKTGNLRQPSPEQDAVVTNLLQVYEMCMILCNHDDHNVITTSLETLQQLFTSPAEPIITKILSTSGIQNSLDEKSWSIRQIQTPPASVSENLAFCSDEASNLLESDLDVPQFRSIVSSDTNSEGKDGFDPDQSISSSSRRDSDLFIIEGTLSDVGSSDGLHPSDDEHTENVRSEPNIVLQTFPEIQIGSLYEQNIPIFYCARFLAYNFLLSGQKGIIRPDVEVRVSVKVLATNCIVNLVAICPEIFKLNLSHILVDTVGLNDQQTIEDIGIYSSHSDPLLRGTVYVLVGTFIQSALTNTLATTLSKDVDFQSLLTVLCDGLGDSSNVGVKCAISGVNACVHSLMRSSSQVELGKKLLLDVLQATSSNPYWLVKVDLIELLSSVDWGNLDQVDDIRRKSLTLILDFLSDEDSRVRVSSSSAIIRFLTNYGTCDKDSWGPYQLFCKECVANKVNINRSTALSKIKRDCLRCEIPNSRKVVEMLESVLNNLVDRLKNADHKFAVAGHYAAIAQISELFEPRYFKPSWGCFQEISNVHLLLSICMDTLRTSPAVYDLTVHQSVLCLAGNLFIASEFYKPINEKDKTAQEGTNPFRCHNKQLSTYGVQLLQHCLAVMKLYQNVIESINATSPLRRQSTSPVISPVKKFSQKLEAEKKAQESESEKKSKGLSFSETVCPNHLKKIHDSVLQSYKVFKSSLDPVVASKFTSVIIMATTTIRKLFSCIRPDYHAMTNLIEEILHVSSILFYLCPVPIMKNICEMLKCIFSLYDPDLIKGALVERMDSKGDVEDFLTFAKTYENILVENPSKDRQPNKFVSDKSSLGSYIRQFESAVVRALRIYTTSSDPEIQSEVLELLVQLIKGHVNYGLVDSSQVFLGFVTKQISQLEEGHLRNPELLTQEIFQFLTILTHEYNSSKKFIDISKIITLCNGLVSAAVNTVGPASPAVSALKFVVNDLFISRGTTSHTNQEKKEYESQRDEAFLMVKQLVEHPKALPIIWLMLKGRKLNNEAKWLEESRIFAVDIMTGLNEGRLTIRSTTEFNNLVALLYSLNVSCIPNEDGILAALHVNLRKSNQDMEQFRSWCVCVNSYWLLLSKRVHDFRNDQLADGVTSSLFLTLLEKTFSDFTSIFKDTVASDFAIDQIGVFLKVSAYLLKPDSLENMRQDLRSQDSVNSFVKISKSCTHLSIIDSRLRLWMLDFLSALLYPKIVVWEILLRSSQSFSGQTQSHCVLKTISAMNEGDVPTLEEWIIINHSKMIINYIDHPDVTLFIRRLSTYRMEQILDQITILLDSRVDMKLGRNILKYLERVADSFLCETAVLAVKLLRQTDIRYLSLETSQFCCHVLSHIHTRKLLFSNKDREFLRGYYSDPALVNKYPRLVTLSHKVLCEELPVSPFHADQTASALMLQWCSKDISDSEGYALVKMLSSMKYAQITSILNTPKFNMALLQYSFRHLRRCYQLGTASGSDVSDLLMLQKRPGFIEKWPLPVAAVELILETLDTWESFVPKSDQKNCEQSLLDNSSLQTNICHMWAALTEMLVLKSVAIKSGGSEDKECCNNFIPTGIFTMSFQYMAAKCKSSSFIPFDELCVFLKFAAVAVCDSSFLTFFDVRDSNPPYIFACVSAIGSILRKLVQDLKINFNFSHSELDTQSGMNDECILVLNEFHFLMEFIQNTQGGKIYLEPEMLNGLRNVVSGLGRCELVNGWILVSHLGWRPQALSKANIFPPIQQIPLEILRNEADMLLKYISKLNLLGVASKIQFEENWVIFLSVINLYVDETFQLQIVTTGLRALSMMLQQSIKIKWSYSCASEHMRSSSLKIDHTMEDVEPELCRQIGIRHLTLNSQREFENEHRIDVNSCIRFLTDLYSQWLQNPQGKMPLHLLSEVIQSIVIMAEYFEDTSQYSWMYETLSEIHKSLDKEDEMLWPHLMYGMFYSAAKLSLDDDAVSNLVLTLESALAHPSSTNISNISVKCALVYLQSHPSCLPVLNAVIPYALKSTQLDEMTSDSETHCLKMWKLLLFIWIHGPSEGLSVPDIEQDTLRNILTVLSPLNKVFVSVRLLVLKALRLKIENGGLKQDIKKTITKVTLETLRTPNVCIFFQAVKLYLTIFYDDFKDFIDKSDLDPEVLMPMAERADVLFQHLRSKTKCHNQIVSKVLPLVIADFLPPSEILNRVIAEFLAPSQNSPELVAPVVAQVFEKAKRRVKEAALVREWILASLPNFLANANVSRAMWSLTLFFVGVSNTPDVFCLLPFAQLRRNSIQVQELFVHASIDFYVTLDEKKRSTFKKLVTEGPSHSEEKKPYGFLVHVLEKLDSDGDRWAIDRLGDT